MLSKKALERTLKHCETVNKGYEDYHGPGQGMCGDEGTDYFEYMRNKGWTAALRFALEKNTQADNKYLNTQ